MKDYINNKVSVQIKFKGKTSHLKFNF